MQRPDMNEVYASTGKEILVDGKPVGIVTNTRLKYGNRVIQLTVNNDFLYDVTEDIIYQDQIQFRSTQ